MAGNSSVKNAMCSACFRGSKDQPFTLSPEGLFSRVPYSVTHILTGISRALINSFKRYTRAETLYPGVFRPFPCSLSYAAGRRIDKIESKQLKTII